MLKKTAASGRFTFVRGGIVFSLLLLYRKITYNVKTYLCAASVSERTGSQVTAEELKRKKAVVLALMNDPMYKPMRFRDIASFLDVPKNRREELLRTLDALVEEGQLRLSKRGRYGKPERHELIGSFLANARGFGFVRAEGLEQDIFIPRQDTHGAMNGDSVRVLVEPGQRFKHAEGRVLEVLSRANRRVVGYYRRVNSFGIVMPDNQKLTEDIRIPKGQSMGAVTGHKVVAEITRFPEHGERESEGRVVEILGHVNDPGTDILSIVRAYEIPEQFPEEVLRETEQIADRAGQQLRELQAEAGAETPEAFAERVEIIREECSAAEYAALERIQRRADFTALPTITIDGEDAKDLDDAISLEELSSGNVRLGVHIADVSEYVRERSETDQEALRRGTSVYLADRVIPMLPHALSNGICSLNEGEERLCLSCMMERDPRGRIISHEICESRIRSRHRMSYTAVNQIVTNREPELCERYADIVPMLLRMDETARSLRRQRSERGYIDFDFPESRVVLDGSGRPVEIRAYERNAATRLIEDFMLAANETVAEEFSWRQLPFLYRVHERPDPEKMKELSIFVNNFGLTLKTRNGEVHPKEIQKLLLKVEDTAAESLISRVALRSMKQARYSTECSGHFGLAAKYYTHFTSPIRRYPDLQIHRIIKELLSGGYDARRAEHYEAILTGVADEASRLERRAEEAERESVKYKKCEYMERHIGEEYEGVISGVTRFGIYVELPNTVEGMIRLSELRDDYYEFDEKRWELVGEMTKKRYVLGGRLRVRVAAADRLSRTVDFLPAPPKELPEEDL